VIARLAEGIELSGATALSLKRSQGEDRGKYTWLEIVADRGQEPRSEAMLEPWD